MPVENKQEEQPEVEIPATEELEVQASPFLSAKLKKRLFIGVGIGFVLLAILSLLFVLLHSQIIQAWPEAQQIYIKLNLAQPIQEDTLVLQKIHSIRRHQDGGMYLIVEGEILNQSKKVQVIPTLTVDAVGLGNKIIESWRIEPSQATIKAGTTFPFSTAIISPKESVIEVNLRFVEQSHDE